MDLGDTIERLERIFDPSVIRNNRIEFDGVLNSNSSLYAAVYRLLDNGFANSMDGVYGHARL